MGSAEKLNGHWNINVLIHQKELFERLKTFRKPLPAQPTSMNRVGDEMKYRKKPVVIEATQWFKNGDHPEDRWTSQGVTAKESEGEVVRYYRSPELDGQKPCKHCGDIMHNHGWVDTLEGGH